jgi:hypothetical protein
MTSSEHRDYRLADLVSAFSLATDLGTGQPMEHALRTCLLSVRLGPAKIGVSTRAGAALFAMQHDLIRAD